jgi:hypothetical protein
MNRYIKSVLRDAFVVYIFTFAFGLASAISGLTVQNSPSTAFLTNLLSGAFGFAIAGIRISANRTEYIAWVAVTFWTINLTNIVLGIQTYAAWVHSGISVIIMAIIGNAFARVLFPLSQSIRSNWRSVRIE